MSSYPKISKKLQINDLLKKKKNNQKISMITAYDYHSTLLGNKANIDCLLIGDSLGMTIQGNKNTLSVSLDEIIYHSKIVSQTNQNSLIISDLPFGSFEYCSKQAVQNCIKIIKETKVDAIKIEGGESRSKTIKGIIESGIPVLGHIGLQPQLSNINGFKPVGKNLPQAIKIVKDAIALERSGCFGIVVECIPFKLAEKLSEIINIPIIGIGSGNKCDGQVLVYHDLIGLTENPPSFSKSYCNSQELILNALNDFKLDIQNKRIPEKIYFKNPEEEMEIFNWIHKKFGI